MSKERKTMDKQNLALWSLVVRAKEPRCFLCGKPSDDAHHLVPREYELTRYNTSFGRGICRNCHSDEHTLKRTSFFNKVASAVGMTEYEAMQKRYRVEHKRSIADLKEIRRGLKHELMIFDTPF